jgi:hypothetical protein
MVVEVAQNEHLEKSGELSPLQNGQKIPTVDVCCSSIACLFSLLLNQSTQQ